MRDSYFLTHGASEKSKSNFKSYGCCQSVGDELRNNIVSEFIVIDEISDVLLQSPNLIERYLELVSNFMDIPITKREVAESDITNFPTRLEGRPFLVFTLGRWRSNKHFVATHTLIRYLWYKEHNEIVKILLNLNKFDNNLSIEDIFAIAHSFSTTDGRALTGRPMESTEGLIFFPEKEKYLSLLKNNHSFNTVFDPNGILLIPSFKIKGTFFEDSEMNINSKSVLTNITNLEIDIVNDPMIGPMRQATTMYLKNKPIFQKASAFLLKNPSYNFRDFQIHCNNITDDVKVEVSLGRTTGANNTKYVFKSLNELNEKLLDLTL